MERRRRIWKISGYTLAVALLLGGMVASLFPLLSPEAVAAPHVVSSDDHPMDPDWCEVYFFVSNKCIACHSPGGERVDLTNYQAIVTAKDGMGKPLVVPGKPEESTLFQYVAWNAEAKRDSKLPDEPMMPDKREEWLTAGQIESLRRWITNGALEYKLPAGCSTRPLMEIDFPSAKVCKTCHPGQYDQWSRSMHHYGQHSPVFEAFNLALIERTSGTMGTFCTRCHTPIGTALGENGSRRNVHRSQISMEGVTCVVCHRMQGPTYKSSGRMTPTDGGLLDACMYGPFDDAVKLDGEQTHDSHGSSYLKSSAFCGTCHDVTSPNGVRLEEAFSEWQNSPAARAGQTCHSCHMGPVAGVPVADCDRPLGRAASVPGVAPEKIPLRHLSDHTFAGPDYSLLPDTEFPHKLDWMYEKDYRDAENLTPHQQRTLDDLRRSNRRHLRLADAKRHELLRNAAKIAVRHPADGRSGGKLNLRVDVTSTTGGHSFPTGFTAERQAWVSVFIYDPTGQLAFASGDLDGNADLRDDQSHMAMQGRISVDRHLLNFQNRFTTLTNKGTERHVSLSVNRDLTPLSLVRPAAGISASHGRPPGFRIAKGSLPPLATIGKDYPIRLPLRQGDYTVDVKLNFRHLPPSLFDHVGVPHLKKQLEVVVIDHYVGTIHVK